MTASAPAASAWRARSIVVRALVSEQPTTTGTRPPAASMTTSVTRFLSASVSVQNSWWIECTDRPPTPGSARVAATFERSPASSISPSGRNGVYSTAK